ncbi:MAG: phosphate/phosphonate ABC transporter permease [Lentilactobacillus diolivorans]
MEMKVSNKTFAAKRLKITGIIVLLALIYLVCSLILNFQTSSFLSVQTGLIWLAKNFIPNSQSIQYWQDIAYQLFRTFLVAVSSTMVAAGGALFLAILGAKNTALNRNASWIIRGFASLLRNIPIVGWAMILLFSFKQNDFTGFLALFFLSLGFLTRAFMETIEDFGSEKIQALQATGANYLQVVFQAVLPEVATALISWILYMIENNIRDATLVGLLTGTGIGFLFDLYFKSLRYGAAGLVVTAIIILVVAIELVSNYIERCIQ